MIWQLRNQPQENRLDLTENSKDREKRWQREGDEANHTITTQ